MKTTISLVAILLFVLQLNAQTATTYSATNVAQTTATIKGHIDPGAGNFYGVEFEVADNNTFNNSTTMDQLKELILVVLRTSHLT